MIDDRTPNLSLALPNLDNTLLEDVARLREALTDVDTEVAQKQDQYAYTPEDASNRGIASGYAPLDSGAKIPSAYLPSYVDDVVEYSTFTLFPGAGESGKIYIALDTDTEYRWTGTVYRAITKAPGTTDDMTEGSLNLFFTAPRARAAQVPATASTVGVVKVGAGLMVSGDGTVALDSATSFTDVLVPIASNGQTAFAISGGYIPGATQLLLNGVELLRNDDYFATDGVNVTLATGVVTADKLLLRNWRAYLGVGPITIPAAPVNSSPVNGAAIGLSYTSFDGGAFAAPDGATHSATQLQLSTSSVFSSVTYDSGSIAATTTPSVPSGTLATGITYYWRMRYQSSGGQWSVWSTATNFATSAAFDAYIATPSATPAAYGDPLEGGFYSGMIWNQLVQSSTSHTLGTLGLKSFTVPSMTATPIVYVGQELEVRSRANLDNRMIGTVTKASGTTLTIDVTQFFGSGTFTDWSVMARYRLIVSPKSTGQNTLALWNNDKDTTNNPPLPSVITNTDGFLATHSFQEAYSPAVVWVKNIVINGYTDWYLPSQDEFKLMARNLKPTTTTNFVSTIGFSQTGGLGTFPYTSSDNSGVNKNSAPSTVSYTSTVPAQIPSGKGFASAESEFLPSGKYATVTATGVSIYYYANTFNYYSPSFLFCDLSSTSGQYGVETIGVALVGRVPVNYLVRAVRRSII